MRGSTWVAGVVGLALGAGGMLALQLATGDPEQDLRRPGASRGPGDGTQRQLAQVTAERDALSRQVEALEAELARDRGAAAAPAESPSARAPAGAVPGPARTGPETPDEEAVAGAWTQLDDLVSGGLFRGQGGLPAAQAAVKRLKRVLGTEGLDSLVARLQAGDNAEERMCAALMLELWNDPAAVPALVEAATTGTDPMLQRCASHALALIDGEVQVEALERIAGSEVQDWGARVNAAYGLAKRGEDRWMSFLIEGYRSGLVPTEMRMAVLQGMIDAAPAVQPQTVLPFLHELAQPERSWDQVMMACMALEKVGSPSSLPDLEAVVASDLPDSARNAARKAVNAILGYEKYPLQ